MLAAMSEVAREPALQVRCRRREAASPVEEWPAMAEWERAEAHPLGLWSGAADPLAATHGPSTARLLWDPRALHLRAEIAFAALHLDPLPPTGDKRHGLWEYDVVELFCSRGEAALPYGEIEGAPGGQWLDYLIHEPRRVVDRAWRSGARTRGALLDGGASRFVVEIALPWAGLGASAAPGLGLRANVYAAQGPPPARRYLALAPTGTPAPDFHVPSRFAHLLLE